MTTLPTAIGNPDRTVVIIDGDAVERESIVQMVTKAGMNAIPFDTGETFLAAYATLIPGCLVLAEQLPDLTGLDVLRRLAAVGGAPPTILIVDQRDGPLVPRAVQAGAFRVIERPVGELELLACVRYAWELNDRGSDAAPANPDAQLHRPLDALTPREREVLELLAAGHSNLEIASQLRLRLKTVEFHRMRISRKLQLHGRPTTVDYATYFARQAHAHQVRKYSGRPYIEHVARVAARVAAHGEATETTIAAAWLHDVVEDTGVTRAEIASRFGEAVAELVRELTNPSKGSSAPRAERKAQDREHLAGASWEAKIIKLIDRIDNLHELGEAPVAFRRLYAEESVLLAEVIGDADLALKRELTAAARKHLNLPPA